jgi:hypothetical protein
MDYFSRFVNVFYTYVHFSNKKNRYLNINRCRAGVENDSQPLTTGQRTA